MSELLRIRREVAKLSKESTEENVTVEFEGALKFFALTLLGLFMLLLFLKFKQ